MIPPPKVFLDTDVILDFLLRREPFFRPAARLFQSGMERNILLLASAGALKDVLYFARKPGGAGSTGSEQRGRDALRLLLQVVEVCAVDRPMWEDALASPVKDTEDALQLACAARNHADFLVTRNVRDYGGAMFPQVLQPEILLATLAAGNG
jgi:predicted nucleic acid-binding protein